MDRLKNAMLNWLDRAQGENHTFAELTEEAGGERYGDRATFAVRFMPIAAVKLDTAQTRIAELEAKLFWLCEKAHMAGQADAGIDPSYSNAQMYVMQELPKAPTTQAIRAEAVREFAEWCIDKDATHYFYSSRRAEQFIKEQEQ